MQENGVKWLMKVEILKVKIDKVRILERPNKHGRNLFFLVVFFANNKIRTK